MKTKKPPHRFCDLDAPRPVFPDEYAAGDIAHVDRAGAVLDRHPPAYIHDFERTRTIPDHQGRAFRDLDDKIDARVPGLRIPAPQRAGCLTSAAISVGSWMVSETPT